jgi:DNA-binding NarL/FixJ family response regulator
VPTVLIVDDHPSFRSSARALLESEGFQVVGEAEDAASALVAVRELHPDVVLLDIQLPDASGFEICASLADNGPTRVVLVSSRDKSDYGACVDACGAVGFIAKAELSGAALAQALA